jgi:TRAP-type mannitol/chloroaromatic compound transport system permease small subunit
VPERDLQIGASVRNFDDMLNITSIVIGVVGLLLAILALFPFLGWANWFLLPIPVIGLVVGVLSKETTGRNLNIVVLVIMIGRLMLGGGII